MYCSRQGSKSVYSNINNGKAQLRIVHNVVAGPEVNLHLDQQLLVRNLSYRAITEYLEVNIGKRELMVSVLDNIIFEIMVNLQAGKTYTLLIVGNIKNLSSIEPLLLSDDLRCPSPGSSYLRVIHGASLLPNVDLVADSKLLATDIKYKQIASPAYLKLDSGVNNLSLVKHNSNNCIIGPIPLKFEAGAIYTVVVSGLSETGTALLVLEDTKTSTIITNI